MEIKKNIYSDEKNIYEIEKLRVNRSLVFHSIYHMATLLLNLWREYESKH